jgi:hypothetical protein
MTTGKCLTGTSSGEHACVLAHPLTLACLQIWWHPRKLVALRRLCPGQLPPYSRFGPDPVRLHDGFFFVAKKLGFRAFFRVIED